MIRTTHGSRTPFTLIPGSRSFPLSRTTYRPIFRGLDHSLDSQMGWRDEARPSGGGSDHELPLETVLDHYGVRNNHRVKQMVSCPIQVDDSRPSMSVDLTKQLWKCHACGKGGDVWVMIQEMEGIGDYRGAREFAEATFGIAGGDSGRGSDEVRSNSRGGREGRDISRGSRDRATRRRYAPSWRR